MKTLSDNLKWFILSVVLLMFVGLVFLWPTESPKITGMVTGGGESEWCNGADINQNGAVGLADYNILNRNWGRDCTAPSWCNRADINRDGGVGVADYNILSQNWGRTDCVPLSRLMCVGIGPLRVHATECLLNPTCGDLSQTSCDSREEGCVAGPIECGNSLCETGEDNDSCPQDCELFRDFYHPEKYQTLIHDGRNRTYMVHIPPSSCFDTGVKVPMVLALHGGGGTGELVEEQYSMNAKADMECFIAVYPNGVSVTGIPGDKQHWNCGPRDTDWYPEIEDVDDVGFISALIDELVGVYEINESMVYVTGISNGALMTYLLACELSDKIAAIAPVAGVMHNENCSPEHPVSVMHFHGTHDFYVPFEGGTSCAEGVGDVFRPVLDVIDEWRELNNCSQTSNVTYNTEEVLCVTYSSCNDSAEVTLCIIKYGGHTVPGGYACPMEKLLGVGKITEDIVAMDEMWEFFQNHPMT